MARFYGHFAAAYGTFWFTLFLLALLTQSHINLGTFGVIGLPILAAFYAVIRVTSGPDPRRELAELRAALGAAREDESGPPRA